MWQFRGYGGDQGQVEGLINSLSGRVAIVVGGARDALFEFGAAKELLAESGRDPVVFAANDIGKVIKWDHWVSLHPEKFFTPGQAMTHTAFSTGAQFNWQIEPEHFPLSGYLAMQLAWIMGCDRIVLCGCPGEAGARFDGTTNEYEGFGYGSGSTGSDKAIVAMLEKHMKRLPEFKAAVRSMSGFTKRFFGGL